KESMFYDYLRLVEGEHLGAEYFVYSQRANLLCPVDRGNMYEVFMFFRALNGDIADRTRSCAVFKNP
ncbi:MAG TPA: hypothetical protein VMT55_01900, partial [Candidatus Sulfotelmatobacter sp.]|nr:hypothetical protein [Candidatus Sulfotelmatobacter sp.]